MTCCRSRNSSSNTTTKIHCHCVPQLAAAGSIAISHFLRCPHRGRKQSWQEFKETLSSTFETWKIDPSLRRVLLFSVAKLDDSDPIPLDNLTDEYTMLMTTQDTIGSDSLLFGYFSPTWTFLQERYLRAIDQPVGHHQASRGIKAIITQTLEQCHCTWLLRNEHLHGTSPCQPHSYTHLHLLAQVTELYDTAPMMLVRDRDIFEVPLKDRRNQTKATLQSFYSSAKPIEHAHGHITPITLT
jgi:hypothetical protein